MAGHRKDEEGREHAKLVRKAYEQLKGLGPDPMQNLEILLQLGADVAAIRKPYDRRDYADLDEARREKVRNAESRLYMDVTVAFASTSDRDVRDMAERLNFALADDKTLIDEPLRRTRELTQAYAESGLAPDEATAQRMANAFRDSLVQFLRERSSKRGSLIR